MSDDPCWDGYEQAGTKEKDGKTVPNCVKSDADKLRELEWRADCLSSRMDAMTDAKADAVSAAEYRKLVNAVDYAIQTLRSARNSEVEKASRELSQALAKLNQSDLPKGKPEEVDYMKKTAQDLIQKRKGDIGKKD